MLGLPGATSGNMTFLNWLLVSEPGFFYGFCQFSWKFISFTRNEAQEQPSLLDTIFDYIFYFGPPGKYLYLSPQNLLHVGRRSQPTCSTFSLLFYSSFLEVQNKRYSQILYLMDYVVPGLHFW